MYDKLKSNNFDSRQLFSKQLGTFVAERKHLFLRTS